MQPSELFSQICQTHALLVRQYISTTQVLSEWPELREELFDSLEGESDWKLALPVLATECVGGEKATALPAAAAWLCLRHAAHLIDAATDLADRKVSAANKSGLAAGLIFAGFKLVSEMDEEDAVRKVLREYSTAGLNSAFGQTIFISSNNTKNPREDSLELYWQGAILKSGSIFQAVTAAGASLQPRLIGRQMQINELEELLRSMGSSSSHVVFVVGEAGVGKTRLVQELIRNFRNNPEYEVIIGHCYEADLAVPYGPFVDLLNHIKQKYSVDWIRQSSKLNLKILSKLIPELVDQSREPETSESPIEKKLLFNAICDLLCYTASRRIVILEDFHWADQTSQELLIQFARSITAHPIYLVCTVRSEALNRRHPLIYLVEEMARDPGYHEIRLPCLTADEVSMMLEGILERPLPAPFVDTFYKLTEGNPFFIEEALRGLLVEKALDGAISSIIEGRSDGLTTIPLTFRESILRRIDHIDKKTRHVLAFAAVLGYQFHLDWLLDLTRLPESELLAILESLIDQQLIVEESGEFIDGYRFRHALTREAVYANLQGRERVNYHRAVMEMFERQNAAGWIDQLAYHSFRARAYDQAKTYSRLAGEKSLGIGAYREAMVHFRTALSLTEKGNVAARSELLMNLGKATLPMGDPRLCRDYWEEARRGFEGLGDRLKISETQRLLARLYWQQGDTTSGILLAHRSVEILNELPPSLEKVKSWDLVSNLYMLSTQPQLCLDWGQKSLEMAESIGNEDITAGTLISMGCALRQLGDIPRCIDFLERGRRIAQKASLSFELARGFVNLGDTYVVAGEFQKVLDLYQEYGRFAHDSGWEAMRCSLLASLADALLELGEWERAELAMDRAIQIGEYIPLARIMSIPQKAELFRRQGKFQLARDMLEGIRSACEQQSDFMYLGYMLSVFARVLLDCQEPDLAVDVMNQCMRHWVELGALVGTEEFLLRGIWVYMRTGFENQAVALNLGLQGITSKTGTALAHVQAGMGQALIDMNSMTPEQSAERFIQLAGQCDSLGLVYHASECRQYLAILQPDGVTQVMGVPPMSKVVGKTTSEAGGLTDRQLEILRLVAEGLSNQEIATRLVLSEHTVHRHLANILTKLDLPSRAAAAAFAARQGWL